MQCSFSVHSSACDLARLDSVVSIVSGCALFDFGRGYSRGIVCGGKCAFIKDILRVRVLRVVNPKFG